MNNTPEQTPVDGAEPASGHERVASTERVAASERADATEHAEATEYTEAAADPAETAAAADRPAGDEEDEETQPSVILVRRRRAPALGLWVLIALAVGFVAGAVTALVQGISVFGDVVYMGVTGVLFVGFPLALVAALADAWSERRRRPRARR